MNAEEINKEWTYWQSKIAELFGTENPDLKAILFIIGVQELGQGPKNFSKQEKEELMHIATCKLLSQDGYYILEGIDQDGWPHWLQIKNVPTYSPFEQELLLKKLAISYLADNTKL